MLIKEPRAADSSVLVPQQQLVLPGRARWGRRPLPAARGTAGLRHEALGVPSWSRPSVTTVIWMWWRPGRADRARSGLSAPNESSRTWTQRRSHRRSNSSTDQSALRREKRGSDVWADTRRNRADTRQNPTSSPGTWSRTEPLGFSSEERPPRRRHLQNLKQDADVQSVGRLSRLDPVPQNLHSTQKQLVRTFGIIEHIRTQDEVQFRKQKQVWRHVPPGQAQHHRLDPVGPAAPSAVLQTGRSLCQVRQDDLCPTSGCYHTWETHTCAQLTDRRSNGSNSPKPAEELSPPEPSGLPAALSGSTDTGPAPPHRATHTCHTGAPEPGEPRYQTG